MSLATFVANKTTKFGCIPRCKTARGGGALPVQPAQEKRNRHGRDARISSPYCRGGTADTPSRPHPACRGGAKVRNQKTGIMPAAPTPLAGVVRRFVTRKLG